MNQLNKGFTTVELMIAIIIGALLISSAYQLHLGVMQTSDDSQRRSRASNVAYEILRNYQAQPSKVTKPCSARTETPVTPSYARLDDPLSTVEVTCPFSDSPDLSLITVEVQYNNSSGQPQQVYRALTSMPK